MKSDLIVALDVPTSAKALEVIQRLPEAVSFYKIGLELFCAEGPQILETVRSQDKRIFLDLKLHDIPRTVERAVQSAAAHGVDLLTVHASGGRAMLKATADAAHSLSGTQPKIIAVTALTSLDENDLREMGVSRTTGEQVSAMAELALSAGVDGLVCSPKEVGSLREKFGPSPILVTPGIRPAGGDVGDQKRVATPAAAVKDGASYLVVGRPILQADDPAAAAKQILEEMAEA